MSTILSIRNINKKYPKFELKDVSFDIEKGTITGFIGRNGAGKTTTLKGIMDLIHLDSGEILFDGQPLLENALAAKQRIGFALSELSYYPNKTVKQMVNVTKRFYKKFDNDKFEKYCKIFNLEQDKKLESLSSGMKVKFSVAIALSHDADLLILDEPTSGLDPISREEVLDIFRQLIKQKDRAILFSTHITSDLDKCANNIVYIHNGEILFKGTKDELINKYYAVEGPEKIMNEELSKLLISYKNYDNKFHGLAVKENADKLNKFNDIKINQPDLDEIMIYLEKERDNEIFDL